MDFEPIASWLVAGLFFGMLALSELGRRIGIARLAQNCKNMR